MFSASTVSIWGKASIGGIETFIFPARLSAANKVVKIQTVFGSYWFPDDSVVSITESSDSEVSINHVIKEYPRKIVFKSRRNPLHYIQSSGFSSLANARSIKRISTEGTAVKAWVPRVICTLCGLSTAIPFEDGRTEAVILTLGINIAFGLSLFFSRAVRMLVLKPGRYFSEIVFKTIFLLITASLLLLTFIFGPPLCDRYDFLCQPAERQQKYR